mmetsp:Transcript_17012/g.26251  ORF Transcript_17012/g.26251 Transcript_17012/m.26251 type:complete len:112 (-) Transcript_17012:468-803(-)|eukprot:CAMPEP_0170493510 /NCGR_PEP_ID=MMETSP0208-20121228/14012_1 /TAXON_ID=197538 /ORGANISM="Strombidium inclinatum, Strain S3" /LENGTH=111 /DNA_ID=CAMNT_0010769445 /DNA_START=1212 /DNA_END=1547 /DNA_ORIENTATION=+
MECLGFVLIYFLKGGLPWQGVKARNRFDKYEIIKDMKTKTPVSELVKMKMETILSPSNNSNPQPTGRDSKDTSPSSHHNEENEVPVEFVDYMKYCRDLKFEDKPDYTFLRR